MNICTNSIPPSTSCSPGIASAGTTLVGISGVVVGGDSTNQTPDMTWAPIAAAKETSSPGEENTQEH